MVNVLRWFLIGVSFFIISACGGGGGGNKTPDKKPPKDQNPVTVLDSTKETISSQEIKTLLENNETTYTKSFTLDNNKIELKLSFDLSENNVTKDVKINVKKLDYKDGELWAKILSFSSSVPLTNVSVETVNNQTVSQKVLRKVANDNDNKKNKIIIASMGEAPVNKVTDSNFEKFIKSTKLNSVAGKYTFTINATRHLSNVYCAELDVLKGENLDTTFSNKIDLKEAFSNNSKTYTQVLNDIDKIYYVQCGKILLIPSSEQNIKVLTPFKTYKMVTDFMGLNKDFTVAEKTLKETRANTKDILNNFMDTAEKKQKIKPTIVDETVTHRITDFDKLLANKTIIPSKTGWKNSTYTPKGDNGRMPLILVHGWDGTISLNPLSNATVGTLVSIGSSKGFNYREKRRDPTKLLLWENSEFHYWHNFLSFYLTSEKLQKKYHIYLYRYTSYKHVSYNAKIFAELLKKVPSRTDLGKGLNKEDGVTIMAYSMGGMVSRAMIEEYKGLGLNADKLKKLITLDTPHHGSIGSIDTLLAEYPKDLYTHGAMDLNYDNFDNAFDSNFLKKNFNERRKVSGLEKFDKMYCAKMNIDYNTCISSTASPYMKYLNGKFAKNYSIYNKKYIIYTAWGTHSLAWAGIASSISTGNDLNLAKNSNKNLDFISNGVFDISTAYIGTYGYSAGGAESVGSSILDAGKGVYSKALVHFSLNPKDSVYPQFTFESTLDLYHKDLPLRNTTGLLSICRVDLSTK